MYKRGSLRSEKGFTLIELLVVIAIIAILAVVVVLTLNPAQMLAQSRDANRLSDMSTLNSAINLYQVDTGGTSGMGTSSIAYVSLPDSSSTCGTWGLPSGDACVPATSTRDIDSTGWIPINFKNISAGSPLSSLPIDPTNQSSTGFYYTYSTNNGQFELIAPMESQKYSASIAGALGPGIDTQGSGAGAPPIGYWPLNEGTGTIAYDISGSGNNGQWYGTASGTNGYYSPGKGGAWAGTFDGNTDYVNVGNMASLNISSNGISIIAWINLNGPSHDVIDKEGQYGMKLSGSSLEWDTSNDWAGTSYVIPGYSYNQWLFLAVTMNNTEKYWYANGNLIGTKNITGTLSTTPSALWFGDETNGADYYSGSIDDVRIYNRALSAAEIQALYASGK